MDFKTELAKIAEAYCVENNIPVRRKFTDTELAGAVENLREAKPIAERIEAELRAEGVTP